MSSASNRPPFATPAPLALPVVVPSDTAAALTKILESSDPAEGLKKLPKEEWTREMLLFMHPRVASLDTDQYITRPIDVVASCGLWGILPDGLVDDSILTAPGVYRQTPVHVAIESGSWAKFPEAFVNENVLSPGDFDGRTPVHYLASLGMLGTLPRGLPSYQLLVLRDKWGDSPVHEAFEHGDISAIPRRNIPQFLLMRGRNDETPLHVAAEHGHAVPAEMLFDKALMVKDRSGYSPVMTAASHGNLKVFPESALTPKVLSVRSGQGSTAFLLAAYKGVLDDFPAKHIGRYIDSSDDVGRDVLRWAIEGKMLEKFPTQLLSLERLEKLGKKDKQGDSSFDIIHDSGLAGALFDLLDRFAGPDISSVVRLMPPELRSSYEGLLRERGTNRAVADGIGCLTDTQDDVEFSL